MRRVALVFVGGFAGTLARYLLSAPLLALARIALPDGAGFPYDTLLINLTGALALGLLYGLVERGAAIAPDVRLTLGTGFLGAYTTFSSFVVGGDTLIAGGSAAAGTVYLLGSIVLGVAAAHGGYLLSGMLSERHRLSRRVQVFARGWRRRSSLLRLVSRAFRALAADSNRRALAADSNRTPSRAHACPDKTTLRRAEDEMGRKAAR